MSASPVEPCPCQSGVTYADCCGPLLEGRWPAATAQALMRSRYTAYHNQRLDYVKRTWHPLTRPNNLQPVDGLRWVGLKIVRVEAGLADDANGWVEFIARSKLGGRVTRLREVSYFERLNGVWVYCHGDAASP